MRLLGCCKVRITGLFDSNRSVKPVPFHCREEISRKRGAWYVVRQHSVYAAARAKSREPAFLILLAFERVYPNSDLSWSESS
jgi:hypothetical protein